MKPRYIAHALLVTILMLALLAYWFLVADRSRVFLYGHLGAQPFDAVTASRYWMAGLVSSGFLVPLYTMFAIASRLLRKDWLADPLMVTLCTALPLAVGTILIASVWGKPPIPYPIGVLLWIAAISGVYLALWFAQQAYRTGKQIVLLVMDGCGIVPVLLLFHALELPGRGLRISATALILAASGSVLFGMLWLLGMTCVYRHLNEPSSKSGNTMRAGLTGFLLLTTLHHLLATPAGYKYISAGSNFFAQSILLQLATWAVAWLMVFTATRLRKLFQV